MPGVTGTNFVLAPDYALSADQTRGLTFAALIFGIVALILVDRSRSLSIFRAISRPNRALAFVVPIVAAMLGLVMFWPRALDLFEFPPPSACISSRAPAGRAGHFSDARGVKAPVALGAALVSLPPRGGHTKKCFRKNHIALICVNASSCPKVQDYT